MSFLDTYEYPNNFIVHAEDDARPARPGDWVRCHGWHQSFGMLVGHTGTQQVVLWTTPPELRQYDLKYNPLAMDEDVFIPVRDRSSIIASQIPTPPQSTDDVNWLVKQLKRMVRKKKP